MGNETENQLIRPRSLGRYLNFATSAVNALCNARLARHDLTLQQWVVLSALWQRDNLTVSEIAAYTGNAGPAASRIVDRMVERTLIGRRPDSSDRRASRIFLTAKGERLRHLQTFYDDINTTLLAGLNDADAEALYALLDHVAKNARTPAQG
jgi:DNA-binding MarR family transcriptional regulator